MLAVEANSPSCIKWLLEKGADSKAALKTGWQALHLALRLGHDSCVLMLLQEVGRSMCETLIFWCWLGAQPGG
jgi:ankyrin repeat protein